MSNFYQNLTGFSESSQITDAQHYTAVPDDWYVSVLDVQDSTAAIAAGRYRDVNFVGAAAITAQLHLIDSQLPFVFGGDGASVLIPPDKYALTKKVLQSLQACAAECFGLQTYVGLVPVSELRAQQQDVRVARYYSSAHIPQAMFQGGGMSAAEKLVKTDPRYSFTASENPAELFSRTEIFHGLSCRWKPVPSTDGQTLSLLIEPRDDNSQHSLKQIITELENIFGQPLSSLSPVNMQQASYEPFLKNLRRQISVMNIRHTGRFLAQLGELLLTIPLFNLRAFHWIPAIKNYVEKIPLHCDFKKYDDTLRMVIDCSATELSAIQLLLKQYFEKQQIFYGMHTSSAAQMTCHVDSIVDGQHLHFIDGHNGGYALAASQLKQQRRNA